MSATPAAPAMIQNASLAWSAAVRAKLDGDQEVIDSELEFAAKLSFFVTIGYLSEDQAAALFRWYLETGKESLPVVAGGLSIGGVSLYDSVQTMVGLYSADETDSFWDTLIGAVGTIFDTVTGPVLGVLGAGTGLLDAAAGVIHQLHGLLHE